MRQGQQNRRGRGRSNRKGQSPLTRSFESTGPEVKIRGTPSHIAEKYMSLARDATSSGDPVLAENYLQHAEHYNRIIMAFRDQQIAQGGPEMNGGMPRGPDGDDFGDDDGDDGDMQPQVHQSQPQMRHDHQPRNEGQRFEGHRGGSQDQNRHRGDRDHHRNNNRFDRNDRGGDQQRFDRDRGGDPNGGPPPRPQSAEQGGQPRQGGGEQFRRRDSFPQQQHEQPEFLRRPVRRPRRESGNGAPEEVNGAAGPDETDRD
jgi:uncharacterized protein DUF4167